MVILVGANLLYIGYVYAAHGYRAGAAIFALTCLTMYVLYMLMISELNKKSDDELAMEIFESSKVSANYAFRCFLSLCAVWGVTVCMYYGILPNLIKAKDCGFTAEILPLCFPYLYNKIFAVLYIITVAASSQVYLPIRRFVLGKIMLKLLHNRGMEVSIYGDFYVSHRLTTVGSRRHENEMHVLRRLYRRQLRRRNGNNSSLVCK